LLAGNIVQVRLEREALSAAVSPTCCSGREQRSKTAYAGGAISMKAQLRKQLRMARRSLSAADHRTNSTRACRAALKLPMAAAGKRMAIYLPFDRETDTRTLIAAARRRGVYLFVPVITDMKHGRMRFFPLGMQMQRGAFGIFVPKRRARPVASRWMNMIVIPLVGVDDAGRRLGLGGGFYDRALAFRRQRRVWPGPRLVGLAFNLQRTRQRFADDWDVRLDSLATESGLQLFTTGGHP
jgi:5-formyltetrahydrofolate cyclo-ligase